MQFLWKENKDGSVIRFSSSDSDDPMQCNVAMTLTTIQDNPGIFSLLSDMLSSLIYH